jgi:sensor c-di-GMP phosphodiesterase-like protein
MSSLNHVFVVGRRHSTLLLALLWTALFLGFLSLGWGLTLWQLKEFARGDREQELARVVDLRRHASNSLIQLQREAVGPPCSKEFLATMRRIAFLPDGLNEFLHAPGGMVKCSTSRSAFVTPLALGAPDISGNTPNAPRYWLHRDLRALGRPGVEGTIMAQGDFAVVIPSIEHLMTQSPWLSKELVVLGPEGAVWNVAGEEGVHRHVTEPRGFDPIGRLTTVEDTTCGDMGLHCISSKAMIIPWVREWITIPILVAGLAALLAWFTTSSIVRAIRRYWSFESRFLRTLDSVVVRYQPIVNIRSGKVAGCEVLARWRDADGTIVAPHGFLPIVERTKRTAEFTQIVVEKAFRELSESVPDRELLQVNFNVFGQDFEEATLLPIFGEHARAFRDRFAVAVELVESQNVELKDAVRTILELQRSGLKIYIDDFGVGYSSIERAATLPVDGVKLDRSFAMSNPDSILGRMLVQVLEMMKVSDCDVVVEGVETTRWIDLLRATGNVDYVQGFGISKPVDIEGFVAFLKNADDLSPSRDFAA